MIQSFYRNLDIFTTFVSTIYVKRMIEERIILQVLAEQRDEIRGYDPSRWVVRREESLFEFDSSLAQVVIGVRRSGKSTLCHKVLLEHGIRYGYVNLDDDRLLGMKAEDLNTALSCVYQLYGTDIPRLHTLISGIKESGYVSPDLVRQILSCAGIPLAPELVSTSKDELSAFAEKVGFPVVAKVVGPVHKSDVGGVALNIRSKEVLAAEFDRMMQIPDATAVMVQKMIKGTELFIGAKYEERFGHVVLCGLGGIFVEVLRDVSSGLAPLSYEEAYSMIRSLRAYKILKGTRGQQGINERKYAEIIVMLSTLLRFATEIKEMDINPLLADADNVIAVDARIRVVR